MTPDTSVWGYLTSFMDTLGGLQALVLVACVIGVISGGVLWAVASGPIARRGRWAVIGSCAGAAVAGNLPALIAEVIKDLS
ncbi:hypothetical protein [uncultured Actinomyces sp.]|uniref:hypothetical protein n=1 Tax=uncultured Actinomyces sp. TaxID=249061 RepID=UPI0028D76F2E|nr:hypothetical protein [uncultured Actinomyces sp.]